MSIHLWMGAMANLFGMLMRMATVAICAFVLGMMLFVIFGKVRDSVGGELIPASEVQEAPQADLSGKYAFWAVGDSTYLCNPRGCAELPAGSIVLTPLPRQVRQPTSY